jgi:hypothetical protein
MERVIANRGVARTVAYALLKSGESPGADFYRELSREDQARLDHSFRLMGDRGRIDNPEKFGRLAPNLFEFKEHQIRMPCAWDEQERGVLVITHGFIKKRDRVRREEIKRARRILEEDQARAELQLAKRETP